MQIALKHGWCLIDDADWHDMACMWHWYSVRSTVRGTDGQRKQTAYAIGRRLDSYQPDSIEMHRLLLGLPQYRERRVDVDHINGVGLDNRRENLRLATRAQNLANSASRRGTSDFKGVSHDKQTGRWVAQITIDGRNKKLGRFDTEAQAALAYNIAAREAWGEFSRLNEVSTSVALPIGLRGSSQYRGVSWDARRGRWIAQIAPRGQHRLLGRFATEEEAALAYNAAAAEAFGERARLNIVEA